MLEDFKIELGLAVAIIAIAVIGKVFMSNNNSPEKRRRSQAVEETSKRSKNETKSNVEEMEQAVVKKSELVDGQMKEVPMGEANILVVKDKDQIYAFGNKCSHQGALLKSGVYSNGRVRCPLHGACFNTKTGDIEDFPCVDGIQTFDVQVKNDEVLVSASKDALKNFKRTPKMVKPSPSDKRVVAIVGAGPAGLTCAQTLRQEGYTGRIVMIGKETVLPYDRTKLSKTMASKPEQILLRPPEFYKENGIETILGVAVTEFDAKAKTLTMADGKTMSFDYGVIATGGDPRTLPVPGMDLANIYQLRVPEEANNIINQVDGKKVVIVGTSFIGMEAAACVSKKAASVIAIGMEKVPFERVLGEKVGSVLQKFHEKNGIQFRLQRVVKEFIGKDGKVAQVVLDNGEILEADLCVVGAGIIPATKFVKPGTLEIARDQSIVADKFLKAADGVYVAGDLARFPFFYTGESVRVEHYGYAMYQGKTVALNILGKNAECKSVPFFWTTQYGKAVRYAGHALSYDEILFDGNLDDMSFVGFYVKNNKVLAAVAIGRDPICSAVAELMDAGRMPTADQLKANNFKLTL